MMRRSMSRVIRLVAALLGLAIMAVAPAAEAEPGDAEGRLRQVLDLVADDAPGRPNRLLGDYAAVKWVQADRQRGPVNWRDRTWSDWQRRTGERPPDFDRLPSRPFLPDPLIDDEGRAIVTAADWRERRRSIIRQVEHWITGTIPPPPDNLVAETVAETTEDGLTLRTVVLRFGPDRRARLTVRLFIPQANGPLPVVITQRNDRWIRAAVRRGFIGCLYAAADGDDDTAGYPPLWPDHDFALLMRRAWGCSRAVDYLHSLPIVDKARVGLIGHSRNGFQAVLAAALDERIQAVVPASATVGLNGFRLADRANSQTLDELTYAFPSWLHPRLRFFVGREDRLPIDMNSVMALVAPRPLLLTASVREADANPWALEQMDRSVRPVYRLLGAEDRLALRQRDGVHGVADEEFAVYLDFFDTVFGRSQAFRAAKDRVFPYTFANWKRASGEDLRAADWPPARGLVDAPPSAAEWDATRKEIRQRLAWLLGEPPPGQPAAAAVLRLPTAADTEPRLNRQAAQLMPFDCPRLAGTRFRVGPRDAAGDGFDAWMFLPPAAASGTADRPPVVVFLHDYAYATGFFLRAGPLFERFLDRGIAVVAIDLAGFHSRLEEGTGFYGRFPRWSLLGKMVADVQTLVTALARANQVNGSRVFLTGAGLGGTVALVAAATDDRIAGVAVCNAFTPLRSSPCGAAFVADLAERHGLVPRLGFFSGAEGRIPVDFDAVLAAVAPRPVLVIAAQFDRHAQHDEVAASVAAAGRVYRLFDAADRLQFIAPPNYNRFTDTEKTQIADWIARQAGTRPR